MRIHLQPAFVLHRRAYRETSFLLDVFTLEHGRLSLIAKGAKSHRSPQRALLQPFTPLFISWQGKSELMTLTGVEPDGLAFQLAGECLLAAFYLNELLTYVLHPHDGHPTLYHLYSNTLKKLEKNPLEPAVLRLFEKKALDELGYGLQLKGEIESHKPFAPGLFYRYYSELGFKQATDEDSQQLPGLVFSGGSLLALANETLNDESVQKEIKRLMRLAFKPLLMGKTINSRELFVGVG